MKFTIIYDNGVPNEIKVDSEAQLKKELLKLKRMARQKDKHPQFDIWVDDEQGNDVTEKMFKKLKVNGYG